MANRHSPIDFFLHAKCVCVAKQITAVEKWSVYELISRLKMGLWFDVMVCFVEVCNLFLEISSVYPFYSKTNTWTAKFIRKRKSDIKTLVFAYFFFSKKKSVWLVLPQFVGRLMLLWLRVVLIRWMILSMPLLVVDSLGNGSQSIRWALRVGPNGWNRSHARLRTLHITFEIKL